LQLLFVNNPFFEDPTAQDRKLQFGNIEPRPVLGRVLDLDFVSQSADLFLWERGVRGPFGMRIQVIADQRDLQGFGKHPVNFLNEGERMIPFVSTEVNANGQWVLRHESFNCFLTIVKKVITNSQIEIFISIYKSC
jgi:hypothetical protein